MHRKNMPSYTPPNHVFRNLLHLILGNSVFEFMEEFYHQISGTSMGTRMAPPYANLFMGLIEDGINGAFPSLISFWKRFIDDIFFIFIGSETQLKEVFTHMTSIHPTIKFTFEYSPKQIAFLDTLVYVDSDRHLQTNIFRKPTDRMCLLHFSSNHPRHVKESIVYTQALRYCTIISDDRNLEAELLVLSRAFLARGYPLPIIRKNISKAISHNRSALLTPKRTEKTAQVTPLVTLYSPMGMKMSRIIHRSWHMIESDEDLRKVWPRHPITAYKRAANLKDSVMHSRQKKPKT